MLVNWLAWRNESCRHKSFNPLSSNSNFCPDCGKKIEIYWYFVKCDECNSSRTGHFIFDKFLPQEKFCKRCGSKEYYVEQKDEIAFFELSYSTFKLKELDFVEENIEVKTKTRVWLEPAIINANYKPAKSFHLVPINAI